MGLRIWSYRGCVWRDRRHMSVIRRERRGWWQYLGRWWCILPWCRSIRSTTSTTTTSDDGGGRNRRRQCLVVHVMNIHTIIIIIIIIGVFQIKYNIIFIIFTSIITIHSKRKRESLLMSIDRSCYGFSLSLSPLSVLFFFPVILSRTNTHDTHVPLSFCCTIPR